MQKNTDLILKKPIDAICFDCDSTLSSIEGIDELARLRGIFDPIAAITKKEMNSTGISGNNYRHRLELIKPTLLEMQQLANIYLQHTSKHCQEVLNVLSTLHKPLFIISAGNNPSVTLFGEKLGFAPKNCFAVDLYFDRHGDYQDFDQENPMITANGKADIINTLALSYPRIIHIGDGMNDAAIINDITRFIGYGGNNFREKVAALSPFYISCQSLLPILPLSLTANEARKLSKEQYEHYQQGLDLLKEHLLINRN